MCGLMLAFVSAAALWHRRQTGEVARIDFSMLEAMLWTMAGPLVAAQLDGPPQPVGNGSTQYAPHNAYRCTGSDDWIAIAVTGDEPWRQLCRIVPGLEAMAGLSFKDRLERHRAIDEAIAAWAAPLNAQAAANELAKAGIAAAALATSGDLVDSPHLKARGFWDAEPRGVLPGLPWQASFGRVIAPAPALGGDSDAILRDVLDFTPDQIAALRQSGALGA
jgi:crotonobetainyl-CoA:carnitine CoA-transferase CaiB-like acyl-CoA transferase